jgi:hypothetical protein
MRLDANHHWLMCSIDLVSKKEKILRDFGPLSDVQDIHGFSLAPDGKSFTTSVARRHGDIWMLEGFPRPEQLLGRW